MADLSIYYINSQSQRFTLEGDDLSFVDALPLYSYKWDYDTINRPSGMGGTASGFSRFPREIGLELRIRGRTREDFLQRANQLAAVADVDALNETPGRLYVGDQYLVCYLSTSGSVSLAPRNGNFALQEVKVLAVEPYWCTEKVLNLYKQSTTPEESDSMSKRFNLRNPYHYSGSSYTSVPLINTHYAPAPMRITIYGAIADPAITINGNLYQVNVTVLATERLVIDQTSHTIYKLSANGEKTNCFNARDKENDIFLPVPAGENTVTYSGEFNASIAIIEQRSQLRWT